MDIRLMQYYLAVVREGNISAAAETLHVSQPALSRQMKDLEDELGVTLFQRGSRRISLTEEGMILRKRAEEMVRLMQLTESEISQARSKVSGDIHIGAGETHAFHLLSGAFARLREEHPDIRLHITSGDTADLTEQLNHGLIDFALIFTDYDRSLYHAVSLPQPDRYGVLMRRDSPLAAKEAITVADLYDMPLIVSRASEGFLFRDADISRLHIVAQYNLIYNASLLVEDGVGYAITFDRLINISGDSPLCFRPLLPEVSVAGTLIWKRYQVFSPAVQLFIDQIKNTI